MYIYTQMCELIPLTRNVSACYVPGTANESEGERNGPLCEQTGLLYFSCIPRFRNYMYSTFCEP